MPNLPLVNTPFVITPRFTKSLTGNTELAPVPTQVLDAQWVACQPTPVAKPSLVAYSKEMRDELGISDKEMHSDDMLALLAGNADAKGQVPFASRYAGHQFGNWAGQLGDGRAITIAETTVNNRPYELQLKGAGLTPFSRGADGRAVLRSSIREFLCSEAMHHLGIPTTRALSLITSGEMIVRDMFYDGRPEEEIGAIVCRVAPSFIRFGHFEANTYRNELENLRALIDFTIEQYFEDIAELEGTKRDAEWFSRVCRETAVLLVHWTRVGFVHGVLNTDNMSILGLTIDYGPYGWLDDFDPGFTPNTTDAENRRYRFSQQHEVVRWNLIRLANALYPAIQDKDALEQGIREFDRTYDEAHMLMQGAKFGLNDVQADDHPLIQQGYQLMYDGRLDFSLFFRALARLSKEGAINWQHFSNSSYDEKAFNNLDERGRQWLELYQARLASDAMSDSTRREHMNRVNPAFILRNYLSHNAILKATAGDYSEVEQLMSALQTPYDSKRVPAQYQQLRPDWATDTPGCSRLSCSS